MKKLLGIMVLSLLLSGNVYGEYFELNKCRIIKMQGYPSNGVKKIESSHTFSFAKLIK